MAMREIVAILPLVWAGASLAQVTPSAEPTLLELSMKAREARLAGDAKGWLEYGEATLARAPDHPDLLLSVSRALALNGRGRESLELLEEAVRRGARVDAAALPEYAGLEAHERFAALAAAGRENQRPVDPPEEFLVLENTTIDTEGIAYDARSGRLFFGSLRGGIWQADLSKSIGPFATESSGLRETVGLKVDEKRRLLWAATAVFPDPFAAGPKPDTGLTGVLAFDLDDGNRVRQCWLDERPVEHGFNDLALASDGDVYVSDSPANSIYRLPGGECRLERVIHDPGMSFPNGIALSADERLLYVAHIEGLSVIDLANGRRRALAVPPETALNSMDGLVRDGEDLIGIQPSPYLARVLRIRLGADGATIREVVTVSSPPPPGVSPTTGVVVGDHYYYVAGVIDPEAVDRRARILRAKLR
jgi:sugar lactone lactonase YvrE